ncbi:MAG TPA: DUF4397 domain-containing protein [Rhodanobacteraceae bacterium]|nr:DUF4397 domain-containing protein [Rhodanobacteraceae bacterium]
MRSPRDDLKCRLRTALVATLATTLAACDNGSSSSDDSSGGSDRPVVAAFNAVPDMAAITFLREEERWAALEYGNATEFRAVGADQYDLNFDTVLPGDETVTCNGSDGDGVKDEDECTRLTSTSVNVIAGHEYVLGLLGRYGDLRVQVYDKEVHEFDTTTTDGDPDDEETEVQFFHWSDALPELDVYLERPGANLSPVQARAALTRGQEWHGVVPDGDYVITLAPVANPSAAVYTSETFGLQEQTRVAFAIMSGAGDGTSIIRVERFRDQAGTLRDRRVSTELRFAHVVREGGALDIYANEDFTQPLIAGLAEGAMSTYVTIPAGSLTDLELDVSPAGNPGVLLAREEVDLARGERSTFVLFGSAGRLDGLRVADPFRRIATHAQLRMLNTAAASLDFFIVRSGSNINTLSPTQNLTASSATPLRLIDPDRYDIVLTRGGTDDVVFGPRTVDLSGGGIYTIIATGRTDLTSADAVLLDDFAP